MRIFPVLDIQRGQVVHARGGERDLYSPLRSPWCDSAAPLHVARALAARFQRRTLYIADLDALTSSPSTPVLPSAGTLETLIAEGFHLAVDRGVRSEAEAVELVELGVADVIAALESVPGPQELKRLVRTAGSQRLVFSLDLKHGRPLGDPRAWNLAELDDPSATDTAVDALLDEVVATGVRRILVLDLGRVGTSRGVAGSDALPRWRARYPEIEWWCGGGVRNVDDLVTLEDAGAGVALLATCLHNGSVTADDLRRFEGESR